MPAPVFTGNIPIVPAGYNNVELTNYNTVVNRDLQFLTSSIRWDNPNDLPRQLNVSLGELLAGQGVYTVTTTMLIEVAGSTQNIATQDYHPEVRFYFRVPNRGTIEKIYQTVVPPWTPWARTYYLPGSNIPGTSHSGVRSVVADLAVPTSVGINFTSAGTAGANKWSGVYVRFTLNISVQLNCSGANLDSPICSEYCQGHRQACFAEEVAHCFPTNIGTSQACRTFVSNYIEANGPQKEIDDGLRRYCSKYRGFGDLVATQNETEIALCACQMPQSQYDNFTETLFELYPGFGNLGLVDRCLFPKCASSDFKSRETGKQCNLPQCINIASFTNTGSFDRSSVTINQNISGCANIVPSPSPPGPTPTPPGPSPSPPGPSPSPPGPSKINWNLIVGIVLAVIVLILLVAIIVVLVQPRAPTSVTSELVGPSPVADVL